MINLAFDYVLQPRMMSTSLDLSPVVTIVDDPRLDGAHRAGRRAARGAADDRGAGPAAAVPGRRVVRRAPRSRSPVRSRPRAVATADATYNRGVTAADPRRARDRSRRERPRLPPLDVAQPAGRRRGPRVDDRRRRRSRVPRRRGWRDRRQRRPRPAGDRRRRSPSRPRRLAYAHGSRLHDRAAGALRGGARPAPADGRPRDLPGLRRLRGDRDRAQARPRHAARPRRAGPLRRVRALGELPRQHPRRARPVGAAAAAPPVRGLARPVPPRQRGVPVPRRTSPGSQALGTTQELVDELDRAFTMPPGRGTVCRVRRASRSSGPRWPPSSRPTATGPRSPTSAGGTACCSSPTRS